MARGERALDAAVIAGVILIAAQLVPLSRSARMVIAPAMAQVDERLYLDARDPAARAWAPISVDRQRTAEALVIALSGLLVFVGARAICAGRGLRVVLRAVAFSGLVASGLAIVQHAVSPLLLYGLWRPENRSAFPYTPFVNRNDLAAWLILAIPLTLGYLMARVESRARDAAAATLDAALDDTTAWLGGAIVAMTAALMVSLSRAGLIGAAAAAMLFVWLSRSRMSRHGRIRLLGGIVLVVAAGSFYVSRGAFLMRLQETLATGMGERREIWDITRAVIRDFPLTGIGVGAYARAISVYQPPHDFSFNHAHNEYLQILSEGGIGLAILVAIAVGAGILRARRLLRADRTPIYWIRAGAVSAALAIAVQSIWETGLRMPANAVLFAVCCAAALTAPMRSNGVDT